MRAEGENYTKIPKTSDNSIRIEEESGIELGADEPGLTPTSDSEPSAYIEILREKLLKEGKGQHLLWLQKILIECCYVKSRMGDCKSGKIISTSNCQIMEPIAYHYISIYKNYKFFYTSILKF